MNGFGMITTAVVPPPFSIILQNRAIDLACNKVSVNLVNINL
jgi:hypothetical protein